MSVWRPSNNRADRSGQQSENDHGTAEKGGRRRYELTVITENTDSSLGTQGWVSDMACGHGRRGVRHCGEAGYRRRMAGRQPNQRFTLQTASGGGIPVLIEVFLTLTLGRRLHKS
jgi:hypothetical protein